MKKQILPVVIGAPGVVKVVKEGIEKQIDKVPENINVTELQKIALLGLAHILPKVLPMK